MIPSVLEKNGQASLLLMYLTRLSSFGNLSHSPPHMQHQAFSRPDFLQLIDSWTHGSLHIGLNSCPCDYSLFVPHCTFLNPTPTHPIYNPISNHRFLHIFSIFKYSLTAWKYVSIHKHRQHTTKGLYCIALHFQVISFT